MTHYYYSSDGSVRSYDTTYTTSTTTWTISPTGYRKQRPKPVDDFPEQNEKLDKFLGDFIQKGTNDSSK